MLPRGRKLNRMAHAGSGIIYVAFGYEYVLMALHSARSAITNNSTLKCALVTNSHIEEIKQIKNVFCFVEEVESANEHNRHIKTNISSYSPFEKTLFLDCDTEVNGDLTPMFDCLDRFDIIAKLNSEPTLKTYDIAPQIPSHAFPTWNTGAIFFRSGEQTNRLFAEWGRIFREMKGERDQPAFARTIYENPDIKLLSVNCLWNTDPADLRLLLGKKTRSKSIIWHYREPSKFLPAARAIYELHCEISKDYCKNNDPLEVHYVDRRYKMMLKPWYALNKVRRLFSRKRSDKVLKRPRMTGLTFHPEK